MARFGITVEGLGATAHGLRHEAMIDHYRDNKAGVAPLVQVVAVAHLTSWTRQCVSFRLPAWPGITGSGRLELI